VVTIFKVRNSHESVIKGRGLNFGTYRGAKVGWTCFCVVNHIVMIELWNCMEVIP